ncbi:pectinesterase inhibitor-like [Lotus japonicus]|uniref:pectinesterase inhibitor-like n=1 Tax=Lotus japonicus TaxID=34305 RepID=UPI0025868961|nr:pectinesterase inhibitor-like [Lotus japonicus]
MSSKYFPSLLLLLAFLLFVASSGATKVVEVGEICKKSTNPSFCLAVLNSNPGGKDLISLAQYTIDIDRANLTNTITLIKSLIANSSGDPKANAHYKNCLSYFVVDGGAFGAIEATQQYLNKRDYVGVNMRATDVHYFVDYCISGDDSPGPNPPPFPDTSLLPKYAQVIQDITEIILIISNLLEGT